MRSCQYSLRATSAWLVPMSVLLAFVLLMAHTSNAQAVDGDVDADFDTKVGSSLNGSVFSVAIQPDGKVLVAGAFTAPSGGLARFHSDGSPDDAFNSKIGITFSPQIVSSVGVQQNGGIIVGGKFTSPGNRLARFQPDGVLDGNFNSEVGATLNGRTVYSLAIQSNDSILVGGSIGQSQDSLTRFAANGTPDAAFNHALGGGIDATVYRVAVQPDDAIVVGGNFTSPSRYLARFRSDGSPDTAFNTAVDTVLNDSVASIALQDDDSILVGGSFSSPSGFLARIQADGGLDSSFSSRVGTLFDGRVESIALQGDGKIVVGGHFTSPSGRIARLSTEGVPDVGFSQALGSALNDTVKSIGIAANGKIVVGGLFYGPRNYLARIDSSTFPEAPEITSVNPGETSAGVSFTAGPANGSPILDYEYQLNGGGPWTTTGAVVSPASLVGLTSGTRYGVQIRAINAVGPSRPSNRLDFTTLKTEPSSSEPAAPPTSSPQSEAKTRLKVKAKGNSKKLATRQQTKIVRGVKTNGLIKKVRNTCSLYGNSISGKQKRAFCGIKVKRSRRNVEVWARPTCNAGLKVRTVIMAHKSGARKAQWKRSWRIKGSDRIDCALPGVG